MVFSAFEVAFAVVGQVFADVLPPLVLADSLLAFVEEPVTFVRESFPVVGLFRALIGAPVAFVGGVCRMGLEGFIRNGRPGRERFAGRDGQRQLPADR